MARSATAPDVCARSPVPATPPTVTEGPERHHRRPAARRPARRPGSASAARLAHDRRGDHLGVPARRPTSTAIRASSARRRHRRRRVPAAAARDDPDDRRRRHRRRHQRPRDPARLGHDLADRDRPDDGLRRHGLRRAVIPKSVESQSVRRADRRPAPGDDLPRAPRRRPARRARRSAPTRPSARSPRRAPRSAAARPTLTGGAPRPHQGPPRQAGGPAG